MGNPLPVWALLRERTPTPYKGRVEPEQGTLAAVPCPLSRRMRYHPLTGTAREQYDAGRGVGSTQPAQEERLWDTST
jgi:hypothetical protein